MKRRNFLRQILPVAAAMIAVGLPAAAQAPELAMLDSLYRGNWDLRLRSDGTHRDICVRSGRELIQIQHNQSGCAHFVVQDDRDEVTVQYTCSGDGYGRTVIRKEGNGLVQLRSQGIQGGTPFSLAGEARHTGPCS
jgi:hypothetical protein